MSIGIGEITLKSDLTFSSIDQTSVLSQEPKDRASSQEHLPSLNSPHFQRDIIQSRPQNLLDNSNPNPFYRRTARVLLDLNSNQKRHRTRVER